MDSFSMSNAGFGSMFSLATLVSALMLPYLGNHIDRLPLRRFSIMVATSLMLAAFTLSVAWNIGILFTGLFLLRLAGQGLSAHTAQTAMTKFFDRQRGKAISIADLGYPLGEASLTLALTILLPLINWRATWGSISLFTGALLIPFVLGVLRGDVEARTRSQRNGHQKISQLWLAKMVMRDRRFFLHLPAVIMPSFWATSLFLYQYPIGSQLGWSATLIASAFLALALSRIISSLAIGPLVDKLGAKVLFPYYMFPIAGGLFIAYLNPGTWSAFAYMFLVGITLGIGGNITSSLWVDMYGKEHVGSVKGLFSSIIIVCASASPFILGYLIDMHIPVSRILLWAVITICGASVLAFLAFRKETFGKSHSSTPVNSGNTITLVCSEPDMVPAAVPVICFQEELIPTEIIISQYSGRKT